MRYPLPDYFHSKNNWIIFYYIIHGLSIWLGFGFASYSLYSNYADQTYLIYPLIALFTIFSGLGLFFIATLGHEGFHGCLNSNRVVSMSLGIFMSAIVPAFLSTGYTVLHWQHHMHTNTVKDPDYKLYSRLNNFFSRLSLGPAIIMLQAYSRAFNLIFCPHRNGNIKYPFTALQARFFAILNLLLTAFFVILYVYIATKAFSIAIFTILLPFGVVVTYFSMAPFIEHAETSQSAALSTRTYTSIFFSFILLGYNFHAEHHKYPFVQVYKLRRLHQYLKGNGFIDKNAVIENSLYKIIKIGSTSRLEFPKG